MTYGSNSFTLHAIRKWNFFQNKLSTIKSLPNLTPTKSLKVIKTPLWKSLSTTKQNFKVSKLRTYSFHWKLATDSSSDIIYPSPGTTYPTMPNQNSKYIIVIWRILLENSQLLFLVFCLFIYFLFHFFIIIIAMVIFLYVCVCL